MNAAACSWRVKINWIEDLQRDSTISRFSSPGIPKIRSKPSFWRAGTSKSEPFTSVSPAERQVAAQRIGEMLSAPDRIAHSTHGSAGRPRFRLDIVGADERVDESAALPRFPLETLCGQANERPRRFPPSGR